MARHAVENFVSDLLTALLTNKGYSFFDCEKTLKRCLQDFCDMLSTIVAEHLVN